MHEHPDHELLRELSTWHEPPVATLFVPIDPAHRDIDRVALKAMLQQAERELGGELGGGSGGGSGIDWSAAVRVAERAGTGMAVLEPADIRAASEEGAVAELLVARSATGVPDLDEAVLAAVSTGAAVWSVRDDELPTGAPAAALLRR